MGDYDNDFATPYSTLVRYNPPRRVLEELDTSQGALSAIQAALLGADLPEGKQQTEDVLNVVLPPLCWKDQDYLWLQTVSSNPATVPEVIALQDTLDLRLEKSGAFDTGVCPVRRELFTQCFDEVIRQETINCVERGILLMRCRNELTLSFVAMETLFCSSMAYGMRRTLNCHKEKLVVIDDIEAFEKKRIFLRKKLADLKAKVANNDYRYAEIRSNEDRVRNDELNELKKLNTTLKDRMHAMAAPVR